MRQRATAPARPAAHLTLTAALAAALALLTALTACRPVQVEGRVGSPSAAPSTRRATTAPAAPTPSHRPATPSATRPSATRPSATRPAVLMDQGSRSFRVRGLQARLHRLSYFDRSPTGFYGSVTAAAVSAFQDAHGLPRTGTVDTTTWQRLTALTALPTHDEMYPPTTLPISRPDPRCLTGRALCVSKRSRTLAWMVNGTVVSAMDVRFGSEYTPTREGSFTVRFKSRHHVSTIYHTPMPYAMFFSGGQAVHYSSDFAARGYAGASHGCVNVRDERKIAALFDQVRTGDKVIVY